MRDFILETTGEKFDKGFQEMGECRLAHPAQAQAGQGDTQLRRGDDPVGVLQSLVYPKGTRIALGNQLCNPSAPHADQGKLSGDEKAVG